MKKSNIFPIPSNNAIENGRSLFEMQFDVRQGTGYSPLNAEDSRSVSYGFRFAYVNGEINILLCV